jgi:hypothetical protein
MIKTDVSACTTMAAMANLIHGVPSNAASGPLTAHQQNERKPARPASWKDSSQRAAALHAAADDGSHHDPADDDDLTDPEALQARTWIARCVLEGPDGRGDDEGLAEQHPQRPQHQAGGQLTTMWNGRSARAASRLKTWTNTALGWFRRGVLVTTPGSGEPLTALPSVLE